MKPLTYGLISSIGVLLLLTIIFFSQNSLANEQNLFQNWKGLGEIENKDLLDIFNGKLDDKLDFDSISYINDDVFVEEDVYEKLKNEKEILVIVKLRDNFNNFDLKEIKKKSNKNIDRVLDLLNEQVEVLEVYSQDGSVLTDLENEVVEKIKESSFELVYRYEALNAFAGKINEEGIEILKKSDLVESVYSEKMLQLHLQQSLPLINTSSAWKSANYLGNVTGKGQTVCVIDSGIDYTHSALGGCFGTNCKVKAGYDFVNNDADPMDDNGHGTHVAGIVAANGNNIKGVAPDAQLVAVKSCNSTSSCSGSAMIAGMNYCLSNKDTLGIGAITMSIGDNGRYTESNCPTWMDFSVNLSSSLNMPFTVSSGNNAYKNGISYPACSSLAISVGATYDSNVGSVSYSRCTDFSTNADKVTCFSNTGHRLIDLMAPGAIITSTASSVGIDCGAPNPQGLGDCSGTSMAAPHVAGTVALMKQVYPRATSNEIENALKNGGFDVMDLANNYIFKRIDSARSLEGLGLVSWTTDYRKTSNIYDSISPKIKIDQNNNSHVVWLDKRLGNYSVFYKKLDNNGNTIIEDKLILQGFQYSGSGFISPEIDLDQFGNIHLIWVNSISNNLVTIYKKLDNNGNTLLDKIISSNTTYSSNLRVSPRIFVDNRGIVHILNNEVRQPQLAYYKLDNNGNIALRRTNIGSVGWSYEQGDLVVDSNYNVHIIVPGTNRYEFDYVYYQKADDFGNILIPSTLLYERTASYNIRSIDLNLDSFGNLHFVSEYYHRNYKNVQIFYSKYTNNGIIYFIERFLSSAFPHSLETLSLNTESLVDSSNNVNIFWDVNLSGRREIFYGKFDSNGNVITQEQRVTFNESSYNDNNFEPSFDIDKKGEVHLVWRSNKSLNNEIYYKKTMNKFGLEMPKKAVIGTTIPLYFKDLDSPNTIYFALLSFDNSRTILLPDGRMFPLNFPLFSLFSGVLDSNGRAINYLPIPNDSQLVGQTIYVAFVTADLSGIKSISPYFPIKIFLR